MRRFWLTLLAALIVGGGVGALMTRDPGYVLLAYDDMSLETSLWFAVILLLGVYLTLRLVGFLIARFARTGIGFAAWNRERRSRGARRQTVQGVLRGAEGQFSEAKKLLVASAGQSDLPLVNYLEAARTAQALGQIDERDALLKNAQESTPGSKFAVGLTRAELQLDGGQHEQALATLLQLHKETPRNTRVLVMLQRCYESVGDWQALLELIPELRRHKAVSEAELGALTRSAWLARITQLSPSDPGPQLEAAWAALPRDLQRDPELVAAMADAWSARDRSEQAERLLRESLNRQWDDRLVERYGALSPSEPKTQLGTAEGWLKQHSGCAALLLALGRIAMRNSSWQKAREYFETSLRLEASGPVYGELARLCVALGDVTRGREYLSQAVLLGTPALPEVPLPNAAQAPDESGGHARGRGA